MDTPKAIIIADRHPISSGKLWRGLTLALLMAGVGITFGGCCAATNTSSATFGVAAQSLPRAELAVKSNTAYASLDPKPIVKSKAVVAAPLMTTSDPVADPLTAKDTWREKLLDDIHESRLRLCNWNEEIKSRDRKFGLGEQQVTGSITTAAVVAAARGPCE
jgi:hypothetical protein